MGVVIRPFRVPILIQVQQNTLNALFLNTAAWIKCVKTRIKISSVITRRCLLIQVFFFLVLQELHIGVVASSVQCTLTMCN